MKVELAGYIDQDESSHIKAPEKSGTVLTIENADMRQYIKITIGNETIVIKASELSKATLVF